MKLNNKMTIFTTISDFIFCLILFCINIYNTKGIIISLAFVALIINIWINLLVLKINAKYSRKIVFINILPILLYIACLVFSESIESFIVCLVLILLLIISFVLHVVSLNETYHDQIDENIKNNTSGLIHIQKLYEEGIITENEYLKKKEEYLKRL